MNSQTVFLLITGVLLAGPTSALCQDPFAKITNSPVVTDLATCAGLSWGDYDNDGYIDLFVPNWNNGTVSDDALYHNNGDGTFTRATNIGIIKNPGGQVLSTVAVWGDYDNDGNLDLLVPHLFNSSFRASTCALYHNNGNGTFTSVTTGSLVTLQSYFNGACWGDYDNDGFIDLYLDNDSAQVIGSTGPSFLFHNHGDGTFAQVTTGPVVTDIGNNRTAAWADYDNDGLLDLFVTRSSPSSTDTLYKNNGSGIFTTTTGPIEKAVANSRGCAWGDSDNSGYLSLFVANTSGSAGAPLTNFLYHNNGDGSFTAVTTGAIASDAGNSLGSTWGDYDNDGFLDLFVARLGSEGNLLYHNNGDGTFTKITNSVVNEGGESFGCAWGDYDNDGFLDLVVGNGGASLTSPPSSVNSHNFLYHNNGNNSAWLGVKLVGSRSNRAGIGAKVRLKAFYAGAWRWQLREISGGEGYGGQNGLRANFGLGDATNIDTLRIEWPSGTVQELHGAPMRTYMTVAEPPFLSGGRVNNGTFNLTLRGARFVTYNIEVSTNLQDWLVAGTATPTNYSGAVVFSASLSKNTAAQFYRAALP